MIRALPPHSCDCHMHIYGPAARFPYSPGHMTLPSDYPLEQYLEMRGRLGLQRTVFVQPSSYATDNSCVLDAIAREAPNARGIAVIDPDAPEAELRRLDRAGIRGVRFHELAAGCLTLDVLEPVAKRIAPFGWHVQIQLDGDGLVDLERRLAALPTDFVVDHMGRIPTDGGVDRPAFRTLLRLLATGRCWVKMSAPYHVSKEGSPDYGDCADRARAIVNAAPDRILWGSNWPHPTASKKPSDANLLDVACDWAGDAATIEKMLVANPARLFGFEA